MFCAELPGAPLDGPCGIEDPTDKDSAAELGAPPEPGVGFEGGPDGLLFWACEDPGLVPLESIFPV